jgi:predicted ATPase
VTFLFTDIEGSTRRWEEDPGAMRDALARHDEVLRSSVESSGGHVVKSTGDGLMAAFARAGEAAQAAASAQRELTVNGLPPVRMGIHTGVAHERDGDYFGPTPNRTARLMAIGHGGQVLVSGATERLLEGRVLRDLGEHRLRDLTRPERVFQLDVDGLTAEFPPLRSLDALPTNLPFALTSFIGRDAELVRVRKAVAEHRLVTLTGVGGVGKTRLALQVAADIAIELRDGAWVSELAPAGDVEAMLGVIATTFDVQQRAGRTLEESIAESLRTRQLLWIVDNCEHLVDPVARLVDKVQRVAPDVRVLATSREGLDVEGEHIIAVRSMAVAPSDDVEKIIESDAARLFAERAAAVRSGFELDGANAEAVSELCRRLDGIPLAIELAASRVASMAVGEIAELLDQRFRLLTGGRRAALERHSTLRAAVDWSYSLLTAEERAVFTRLCVFAGSFDSRAVGAVATDDSLDRFAVLDALDRLVRKSMVAAEEQPDGSVRYQLLETLRQYALERLEADDDPEAWWRQHAEHYAAVTEEVGVGLLGPDEYAWRARLELDLDNVRAAAQWALQGEQLELLTRVIRALSEESLATGPKFGRYATRALALAGDVPADDLIVLLQTAAFEAYDRGDLDRASELAGEAWALGVDPTRGAATLVAVYRLRSTPGIVPLERMEEALEHLVGWVGQITADARLRVAEMARLHSGIATVALQTGRIDVARVHAYLALDNARRSRNPSAIGQAFYEVGAVNATNDPDEALRAYDEAIEYGRQGANIIGFGAALFQSALLRARRGEVQRAARQLGRAIEILRPRGRTPELDGACGYAVDIFETIGDNEAALVLIGAILDGVLIHLQDMPVPPDRTPPDVRGLREVVGRERFAECISMGQSLDYDQLLDYMIERLKEPTQRGS